MKKTSLGKLYGNGEIIVRQGEVGDCMYAVQSGQVEVFLETDTEEIQITVLKAGDFFGEMAIFDRVTRSASVRSMGECRVLTVDKKSLLRKIHEDPTLAFRLIEVMSQRIRELNSELMRIKSEEKNQKKI